MSIYMKAALIMCFTMLCVQAHIPFQESREKAIATVDKIESIEQRLSEGGFMVTSWSNIMGNPELHEV